jgi:hypothetical protein
MLRAAVVAAPLVAALTLPIACAPPAEDGTGREQTDAGPLPPLPDAGRPPPDGAPRPGAMPTFDVDARGVPRVVTADYIDLEEITAVSLFRSSMGHDYWDSFERCRSLKHYFVPRDPKRATDIEIRAPFAGEVTRTFEEWAGFQVQIRAEENPAVTAILFHVALDRPLAAGERLSSGQRIGNHVGAQTSSDIAMRVETPGGAKLVSYIEALTDEVWGGYRARGIASRDLLVISKEARDADPLTCDGERFLTKGTLPQRVELP